MKGLGKFLVVVGCIVLALGIAGVVITQQAASESGIGAGFVKNTVSLGVSLGATSGMDISEQASVYLVHYQDTLLICGGIALLLGIILLAVQRSIDNQTK